LAELPALLEKLEIWLFALTEPTAIPWPAASEPVSHSAIRLVTVSLPLLPAEATRITSRDAASLRAAARPIGITPSPPSE
jgi:hypothetical protein